MQKRLKYYLLSIILFSSYSSAQVSRNFNKKIKPLYEIGGGFAYFTVPNYPGSKNSSFRFIPFPLAIYRGNVLRADEDGARARLMNSKVYELGFSGGFNFPIKSSENNIREGMPDTDALVGLGPAIIFKLRKTPTQKINAAVAFRSNFEFKNMDHVTERGILIEPYIRFWLKSSPKSPLTYFTSVSFGYADSKYNSFFYSVPFEFKSNVRGQYRAKAGIVDTSVALALNYDFSQKVSIFTGIAHSTLAYSANNKSPLIESSENYIALFGLTWLFEESQIMVQ